MSWIVALTFMTLVAGAAVGLLMLFRLMRRREDARIAEGALIGKGHRHDAGALPELAGVGVVAVAAMAMLTVGYALGPDTPTPITPTEIGAPEQAATQMTDPSRPRANPAEFSSPPTQYPLGSGAPEGTAPAQ